MKTQALLPLSTLLIGFLIGYWLLRPPAAPTPDRLQQLTLEEILSIKELHLVKHTYTDLLFLHKDNNPTKPIRAIAQVPVTVTAFLDLKDVELIKSHDTLRAVVLPRAQLNAPNYEINQMKVRQTRHFQLHAGKDQYPVVGRYFQAVVATRIDSLQQSAMALKILHQAEQEAVAYVQQWLRILHHPEVTVTLVER